MSHPLDEVQFTPWGRRVDDDIALLKAQVKEIDNHVATMHLELKANTVKTDSVKVDTQWIVDVLRGSRALMQLMAVVGGILIAVAAIGTWLNWPHK